MSGNVVGMVQADQARVEAVKEIAASLYGMIDTYVSAQRSALALFPECGSAVAVALGAQLDQLEAMAREGARTLADATAMINRPMVITGRATGGSA